MEKYDIISVVGEGSYGLVMRCRHRESGQYVAIKKFLETEDDPTVRKMALREIRMLKKLRHENLVNMIEVFRRKKRFFLVFEYLEHTVLEELEARAGGLGFVTSRKYIYQVLRALDFIHSHNVIHRDIKPENVLVSRLGVIKLCDFGFARPYMENETFTDYVATRWYRSPELLVGDPRYGKEVDIWAVGCLYSEMMTGEPLFPGESDIDQLFQIVRVLGKLNARHQVLIMRNAMFKCMKQEQSTSLIQLFPDWNRDCLEFLTDCLIMDSAARPDTGKLLNHNLFVRDHFLDSFLTELRAKLSQEMQVNPLLRRIPSYGSGRKGSDEKQRLTITKKSGDPQKTSNYKEKTNQISLSFLSSNNNLNKINGPANSINNNNTYINNNNNNNNNQNTNNNSTNNCDDTTNATKPSRNTTNPGSNTSGTSLTNHQSNEQIFNETTTNTSNGNSNENSENINVVNLSSFKEYLHGNNLNNGNLPPKSKQITINNLVFTENNKYTRILSAKASKSQNNDKSSDNNTNTMANQSNGFDMQILPPSPVPFQSLQPENLTTNSTTHTVNSLTQSKRLSPVNGTNGLSINGGVPQYFNNYRRSSNIFGLQQMAAAQKTKAIQAQTTHLPAPRTNTFAKRERDRNNHHVLDVSLVPIGFNNSVTQVDPLHLPSNNLHNNNYLVKEPSPRILPPPPWLTGNLKITAQGKTTQIANNGKKRITDWRTVGNNGNPVRNENSVTGSDFILPNCPGATISPQKSSNHNKKKLSPIPTLSENNNLFNTPRNFSASLDQINDT